MQMGLRIGLLVLGTFAALFGSAGRFDLPMFWAYLIVLFGLPVLMLRRIDPDVLKERMRPGGESRDNLMLIRLTAAVGIAGQWIVAGLDVGRYHFSDSVPFPLQVAGLAAIAVVFGVWFWAMSVNKFFSTAVRIQTDRGHHVVTDGPYRFVRHPGYAAFILLGGGGALALGSWWAMAPHALFALMFLRRCALEDDMLRNELPGYADYAATVRYRLVPGIW